MNDINTAENPGDATWLWYPGDYEIWLHALVSLRRERNGAIEPPFWRLDTSHPKVLFRTKIKGPIHETVRVAFQGEGSMSVNGAITHLSPLLTDRGVSAATAALAASALGLASFCGRLLTGFLLDRFFGPRVGLCLLLITALGIFLLSLARSAPAGIAAAMLIGLGLGAEADITPYLLTRYFGLRSFSTLYGFTWSAYALAGAIGPVVMGRAFDVTGSYAALLVLLATATALSAGLYLFLPKYPRMSSTLTTIAG